MLLNNQESKKKPQEKLGNIFIWIKKKIHEGKLKQCLEQNLYLGLILRNNLEASTLRSNKIKSKRSKVSRRKKIKIKVGVNELKTTNRKENEHNQQQFKIPTKTD